MNYVILNGVSSRTIAGLLIQELPPISLPRMRVEVAEIDGRDGDTITELGYSAYDKELTIGLYGAFDINAVIAFFASRGTVTFSNEPDKAYRYQVLEQIDFERLVRFRTATVTMHVQPFKYKADEVPVEVQFDGDTSVEVTNSGNTTAKPRITIWGSGDVLMSVNGIQTFSITMDDIGYITIDAEQMEAVKDNSLMNRRVTGDYSNFVLQAGENTISFTGTGSVTEVQITNYSRWL